MIDTQIVLEGRPLAELPWSELEPHGPILLICTPTMLSEVDRHKRDGRVGPRARQFNRSIEPAIGSGTPATIVDGCPKVDLALVASNGIDWSALGDLDKDEGDDRIVAEALNARVSDVAKQTMFSYDTRPRFAAARHGLKALRPPDPWILPPEPSPSDKKLMRARQRVQELEATQPELRIELSALSPMPLRLFKVEPPSEHEAEQMASAYFDDHSHKGRRSSSTLHDYTYDDRYDEFERRVNAYGRDLGRSLERLFNQIALELRLTVEGSLHASHVDLQVSTDGGQLHDQLVIGPIMFPPAPDYRPGRMIGLDQRIANIIPPRVGRHEVVVEPPSTRTGRVRLTCEDFRHGRTFERRLYLTVDAAAASPIKVQAVVTASNLKGRVCAELDVPFEVQEVDYDDLIDLETGRLKEAYPLHKLVTDLSKKDPQDELDMSDLQ